MNLWPIISQFKVSAPQDDSVPCTISWSYVSDPLGLKVPSGSIVIPDPTEQYLLVLNNGVVSLVSPIGFIAGASDYVMAWIVGLDVFSKWFYDAELPPELQRLSTKERLWGKFLMPESRSEQWGLGSEPFFVPISALDLGQGFHFAGNNYPGPGSAVAPGDVVEYIERWPGYKLQPPTTPLSANVQIIDAGLSDENNTSGEIAAALMYEFALELQKQEFAIKNYWTSRLTPFNNTDLWGLNREPWLSILAIAPELAPWLSLAATASESPYPLEPIWVSTDESQYSRGAHDQWQWRGPDPLLKYGDLGLQFYDITDKPLYVAAPDVYGAVSTPGGSFVIVNLFDSWEPEIDLSSFSAILAPSEFVRGYRYRFDPLVYGPGNLPIGSVTIAPGLIAYPRDTTLAIANFGARYRGIFNSRLSLDTVHWLFDLCKFTQGKGLKPGTLSEISATAEDLGEPLRLSHLEPLVAGTMAAGDILGHSNNDAIVKLPLFYKRDGKMWRLAQAIVRAMVPLECLEIGYHLFTADYSVAGEPLAEVLELVVLRLNPTSSVYTDYENIIGTVFYYVGREATAVLPYQPVSVSFALSGTANTSDYNVSNATSLGGGVYELTLNSSDFAKILAITVNPDSNIEPDETVIVTPISSGTWAASLDSNPVATYNILNDDSITPVTFSANASILESSSGTIDFTITRGPGASTIPSVPISFTVGGTAIFSVDYSVTGAASFSSTAATIIIPAGANSVTVSFDPINENLAEANETIVLTAVPNPLVWTTIGTGIWTGTINNDDLRFL